MMQLINKYKAVIIVVLPVSILILIKVLSPYNFKNDARKWAGATLNHSNVISGEQIGSIKGEKLIINLSSAMMTQLTDTAIIQVVIPPDSIINKKYLNMMRNHSGPVLFFSPDPSLSARIWMVVSQMGLKNLYILSSWSDNELLKSEFRPDTLTRPEL
jgi:hypothetical protein